jgi:peroxiredoxin Q/BCP
VDDMETQKSFKKELELPFELLSDNERKLSKAFGVLNKKGNYAERKTFIIDPEGKIAYIFHKVDIGSHGEEVTQAVKELQYKTE